MKCELCGTDFDVMMRRTRTLCETCANAAECGCEVCLQNFTGDEDALKKINEEVE